MDVSSVSGLAGQMAAQRTEMTRIEGVLNQTKKVQDLQSDMVARLLASIPGTNPDGIGGAVDITI